MSKGYNNAPGTGDEPAEDKDSDDGSATPFFDPHAMDGVSTGENLRLAVAENLGMPRADFDDMLQATGNNPSFARLLDVMTLIARAQSNMPRVGFLRMYGELIRMAMRHDSIPGGAPNGLRMTVLDGDAHKGDFHGMHGALVVSRATSDVAGESPNEFLFAIVGHDPKGENVLSADNSAVVFADPALMTPDRIARAESTYRRMADLQNYGTELSPEELVQTGTEELLQGRVLGQTPKPWTFEGSTND